MRRLAICVSALSSLVLPACDRGSPDSADPAKVEATPEPEPPPPPELPPPPPPPRWLRIGWDTKLWTAPVESAPALTLRAPESNAEAQSEGRVIRVVGRADPAGGWWQLETVASLPAGVPGATIEGLDVYALNLYIQAGTGEPLEPDPNRPRDPAPREAALLGPPPLQSGQPRPPDIDSEWHIAADAKVYWPDGTWAGSVRTAHAFVTAGASKQLGRRELTCFGIRVGPLVAEPTELCFEPSAVSEAQPLGAGLLGDELGDLIGESVGSGGLGFRGTGQQNTGPNYGPAIGDIGSGPYGYGSGSKTDGGTAERPPAQQD